MQQIEKLFNQFLECVNVLQAELNVPFAEALTETFDNLETGKIKVEQGAPGPETVQKLAALYGDLQYEKISSSLKAQVFTLLTLKALNDDDHDYNQMPTPSSIVAVISLLWHKLIGKKEVNVLDPAIGTGNLLYELSNQLSSQNHSVNNLHLAGIDNDESMLALADVSAHLHSLDIELVCQDAIQPWLVEAPDVIVSDLPVGYYPLDENAKTFATRAKEGHSLTHQLLIEQVVKYLKRDGWAFLIVPNLLFAGDSGQEFIAWLAKKVNVNAILQLPSDLFANSVTAKSILVFQNHGTSRKPAQILLARLHSLKQEKSLVDFSEKLNEWYTNNIS